MLTTCVSNVLYKFERCRPYRLRYARKQTLQEDERSRKLLKLPVRLLKELLDNRLVKTQNSWFHLFERKFHTMIVRSMLF
jgi:hypothetical protein